MSEDKKSPLPTDKRLRVDTADAKLQNGTSPLKPAPASFFTASKTTAPEQNVSDNKNVFIVPPNEEYKFRTGETTENKKETTKNISDTLERMLNLLEETSNSLAEREQMFKVLADLIPSPVIVHHNLRILFVNTAAANFFDMPAGEMLQKKITDNFAHSDDVKKIFELIQSKAAGKDVSGSYQIHLRRPDGVYIPHNSHVKVVSYGGVQTIINVCTDVSEQQAYSKKLIEQKRYSEKILDALSTAFFTTDIEGRITSFNTKAEEFTGRKAKEVLGVHASLVIQLVDTEKQKPISDPVSKVLQNKQAFIQDQDVLIRASGENSFKPVCFRAVPLLNDKQLEGVAVELHDIQLGRDNAMLTYQATHDSLTGLINRREFENRLNRCIQDMTNGIGKHVLFYIDLNRFKPVNDNAGHQAGDAVLKQVADKLKELTRETDSVGRLGGDEFGILLLNCPLQKAKQIAQELCENIPAHRFKWEEETFTIGLAIGIVQLMNPNTPVTELLNAADTACYVAKEAGGSRYHLFSEKDVKVSQDQGGVIWRKRISDALEFNGFELFLQKIRTVDSVSKVRPLNPAFNIIETSAQIPSYEVNVRMIDNFGTMYRPELFMPSAKRYGMLSNIDRLVVQNTFDAIEKGWIELKENECCSINLSAQTFSDEDFLSSLVEALDTYEVNPKNLCFEVPEPDVIENLDAAKRFINVLNDFGCQFALDDFGRELQSFSYLRELNIHYLKLDGFYIRTIVEDEVNRAMVAAMIKLAHSLGMRVIAEQVERVEVLNVLAELGADFAQGHAVAPVIHLHDVTRE